MPKKTKVTNSLLKVNLNDTVKVKLTSLGKQHLQETHAKLHYRYPVKYIHPEEDKDGFSTWQLWELMGHFGKFFLYPGMDVPFETIFYLSTKNDYQNFLD